MGDDRILLGDNLPILKQIQTESIALIYIDPPFNTGKRQARTRLTTTRDPHGDRVGFGGRRYRTVAQGTSEYHDSFDDYLGFLRPRIEEAKRILTSNGSLFFHIDWRQSARCRILIEDIFGGPEHCLNEIIWAYDYGGRSKRRWSPKHDNIYWFAKNPNDYIFNYEDIDRIPYLAPSLVGKEKAARGKRPTDTWWQTIVPTNSKERTGYPTQKPLRILSRIIKTHSRPGDTVLDFFAGSGTTGEAARIARRQFVLVDENPEAVRVMRQRLAST